ncbi:hypothetical protein [Brevundimonas diminuta]|jgi:hypothetical protein|uniref:hypothetical protein n=1 Tax=Brevundimonas diminuta TaxID=293 RepID=UPI000EBA2202|nr:hypothetical protein [Brevundimonas diminuta]
MLKALHFELIRSLSRPRFDLDDEKACQAQIYEWLVEQFPEYRVERERKLGLADRVDFFIAGVAIEVKMNRARPAEIVKQMRRYADNPEVSAVIVLSNRALQLPGKMHGRPVYGVSLGRAWL